MNSDKENITNKDAIKKLLKYYRGRLTLLEKYRNIDINKEILDCLNEINKLKERLKEIENANIRDK